MAYKLFEQQQFKIKYDKLRQNKSSFAKTYQVIWITNGSGKLNIGNNSLTLNNDQLLFIPASVTYTVIPSIELSLIKIYVPVTEVKSGGHIQNNMLKFNTPEIKTLIATFIYNYNKRVDFDFNHEGQQLLSDLLPLVEVGKYTLNPVLDERVLETLEYIDLHVNSRFSVNDIANNLHINPTYLSTLFKKEVGTTIVKYTNNLRLDGAINDLQKTNLSITQIAHKHGFADVRTLNELVKERYQFTPMQIRNRMLKYQKDKTEINTYEQTINRYRNNSQFINTKQCVVTADYNHQVGNFKHSFNTIAVGRAHDILYSSVQTQLAQAKVELNFKYCRFHNIFGDEMNIIDQDYFGNIKFNFEKPFRVINFLLSNQITPFIELGFFPKQIADQSISTFSGYTVNVGGTINFDQWQQMISEFFTNMLEIYGAQVFKMRFDLWNEIDIKAFWPNSKDDLYKLYKLTYTTIKSIDSRIKLGGFNYGNFYKQSHSITSDLEYLAKIEMLPDFLTIHSYPIYIEGDLSHNPDVAITEVKATYIKDKLNEDIDKLVEYQKKYCFDEVYITEWNTSPMQREHLNDSIYKSSKIISEVINSRSELIDGICYWTLSDEMAEFGYPVKEVHGGFGLFTRNGIKKPAYFGYQLSTTLQGEQLYKDDNCIIIRQLAKLYVLINNPLDYDRNYYNESFGMTAQTMEGSTIETNLELHNLPGGIYKKTSYQINQSIDLDTNFKLLFRDKNYLSTTDIEQLHLLSKPTHEQSLISVDQALNLSITTEPTCTNLITFELIDEKK